MKRFLSQWLVIIYAFTHVVSVYAGETNYWEERRRAVQRRSSPVVLTSLSRSQASDLVASGFGSEYQTNQIDSSLVTRHRAVLPGMQKEWGWLPELVANYGDIREIYVASRPDAPVVIHLQDVHEVEDAQKNLAGLVESFHTQRGISLVGLEGALGSFELAFFREGPLDVRKKLCDHFLKLGYLTGPEVAGIIAEKPPTLWGIEDVELYRGHVEAFEQSESGRAQVRQFLTALTVEADKARETFYSPALRALDDHRRAYLSHRASLGEYVPALWSALKGDKKAYPQVALLVKLLTQEQTLDFKEVERQRVRLAEVLAQRLAPGDLDRLVNASLAYRSGRQSAGAYQKYLASVCRQNNIRLDTFGPLAVYMDYVQGADPLDSGKLLDELDRLELAALTDTAETNEEKKLVEVFRGLALLDKLTNHGLTPQEWRVLKKDEHSLQNICSILTKISPTSVSKTALLPDLSPYKEFCKKAEQRNGALVKNLLAKMKTGKVNTAVLVAGGFHTEGMTALLKEANASYVVLTPKISKVPDTRPLDIFVRAPLPLEKLLAGDFIHLAYPRLTQKDSEAIVAANNAFVRKETLYQAWATGLSGARSINGDKKGTDFFQQLNQRVHSALAVSQPKRLIKELPFFIPPVLGVLLAEFLTSGLGLMWGLVFQVFGGMAAAIFFWPKFLSDHAKAEVQWLRENSGKTHSEFQRKLFIAYWGIVFATIGAMILSPEVGFFLAQIQGPVFISSEIGRALQSIVLGGFLFHGVLNFLGRLARGAAFVPAMADVDDSNNRRSEVGYSDNLGQDVLSMMEPLMSPRNVSMPEESLVDSLLNKIKKMADNDVLWKEILLHTDPLFWKFRPRVLAIVFEGAENYPQRMKSLFDWCENNIRPNQFNANKTFMEGFFRAVLKSNEGEALLSGRIPRLLELLMGLVRANSHFEILPAIKMMDQLLEASPQLERRGGRPVGELLRSHLTEILSQERSSPVDDETHFLALLRFSRKVGVDPELCSDVTLRRLAASDWFKETFVNELKAGRMGSEEAEWFIGKDAESKLAGGSGSPDSFLSSSEAQARVSQVLAVVHGGKEWERSVNDFHQATDPNERLVAARRLEGMFHDALGFLRAVHMDQREAVETLAKLVPSLSRMKPVGFSTSLFLSGESLLHVVGNITALGHLLDKHITDQWDALNKIRPVIPLEPGVNYVEVLGYTFPSILGTWMGGPSMEVRPVQKNWNNYAVISADPTIAPDQEILRKSSARKRLLAIDKKGRSLFATLAGAPMTRRDAETLLRVVEQLYEAFRVLEQKKGLPPPDSPPAWESLKQSIRNGIELLGGGETISSDLQQQILGLPRPASHWDEVGTLHQALNYMHQKGKELFIAAAKEAKVSNTVTVGGITMSVANLSGNPLESNDRIVNRELRQFLRALEKPGTGPGGSLVVDDEFFQGSIALGIHSVDFLASIAPPEDGGGIEISFLEWRPKEGNTMRLAFLRAVLDKLGFKTDVKEGMYLDGRLDIQSGAVSQEQIEKTLFLVVRALYHTPDLNLKFDHVIEAKRQEEGMEMAEAFAATQRNFSDFADVFLAEESLPFLWSDDPKYSPRLDLAYLAYEGKEAERNRLRAILNDRLSRCGLSPIPETIRFGQGTIQSYYTEPLLSAVGRGEVLLENEGPVRNLLFRPIDDLASEALANSDELMKMAAGIRTLTAETIFRPIGAVGELTVGECHWPLSSGDLLVFRGLLDHDAGRLLYATARLFTTEGAGRRLSLEELASYLRAHGFTMGSGEEMRGPLRSLTEGRLRAQPRTETLPGGVHRGSGISPGAGGVVAGVVTFDREFHQKTGARADHILVVDYTTPSDFDPMKSALATLTLFGNPETHSAITLRELHHTGVTLRGARWATIDGELRLRIPVERAQKPRLGEGGLWITPGLDVEEHLVGPGSVLLVNGKRGVVSIPSGKGVSEVYQKWRALAEHRASSKEVVASVESFGDWETLEFALFLAISDGELSEPDRTYFFALLDESVGRMKTENQKRYYMTKKRHLDSMVEQTDKDLVWLVDTLRWATTFIQISFSSIQIRQRLQTLNELAASLLLPTPRAKDLASLTKEANERGIGLRKKSLEKIQQWLQKTLEIEHLPAMRNVLKEAELNGVSIKNRKFQRLAKKGRALFDEKRKAIRRKKAWVYRLDKVNRDYTKEVGGKFANLGESEPVIRQEGAFVPPALVVTSDGIDVYHLEAGIGGAIDKLSGELDEIYDNSSLSDAEIYGQVQIKSQEMRDLIERSPIDGELALGKKILTELDAAGLGNVPLILRSTLNLEDGRKAAFAGGAKSYPNVSRNEVLRMVPKVESSYWLSRGVAYRAHQGEKQKDVRPAVMIQELINGEISGVMMTVNPITGEDSVVITAGYGLNEGIEGNLVECDVYSARKSDGELITHPTIPLKLKKLIPNPTGEGTILSDVPLEDQKRQVLSADQIRWLVRVGKALEEHYNEPRNVEYSFVDGKLAIFQDRPVTTTVQEVSPAFSTSPLGLLPLIGRPVYTFLISFHVNRRLATGIAGVVEQGVLVSLAGGLAWLLNWVFGIGFVWGLSSSTAIIWKMFPKSHGSRVFVYDELRAGWDLKPVNVTDDHIRSLRQASNWFFGSFLVVTLIPIVLPLLGIAVPGSLEQWFFAGATISSLIHGLGNSFRPVPGKVAAMGSASGRGQSTNDEAINRIPPRNEGQPHSSYRTLAGLLELEEVVNAPLVKLDARTGYKRVLIPTKADPNDHPQSPHDILRHAFWNSSQELGVSVSFDFVYDISDSRSPYLLGVYPAPSDNTKLRRPVGWYGDQFCYVEVGLYDFEFPFDLSNSPLWKKSLNAFEKAYQVRTEILNKYQSFRGDNHEWAHIEEDPFLVVVRWDEKHYVIPFDPRKDSDQAIPLQLNTLSIPKNSKVQMITLPLYPLVYSPAENFQTDRDFMRTLLREVKSTDSVLIPGPGAAVDVWLASLSHPKTISVFGVNPFEVASANGVLSRQGYSPTAFVGDARVVLRGDIFPDNSFSLIAWDMPWAEPSDNSLTENITHYWDGHANGNQVLKTLLDEIPRLLTLDGRAILWNFGKLQNENWMRDDPNEFQITSTESGQWATHVLSMVGGRWPIFQRFYNYLGKSWLGQVLTPVLVEWVVPASGIIWAMAKQGIALTPELLVGGVLVYLLVWHLLHTIGAPGTWKEKLVFAFSQEKRMISCWTIMLALLTAVCLNFGVSPDVLGAQIVSLISVPHLEVNRQVLRASLLGGSAGEKIAVFSFVVAIDDLREEIMTDRQSLNRKRDAMVGSLGLSTDVSEEAIAGVLGRGHGSSADEKSIKKELKILLAPSLAGLDGDTALKVAVGRVTQIVDAYHAAQGLYDFEKALDAAIADKREIALELTISMVRGDLKHLTPAENAQWDRLMRLAQAASRGELKKPVRLVLPEGITKAEVENVLSRGAAGALLENISTKPKNELALAEGTYSLRRFVEWVRGGTGGKIGPIEMYLMSRNEWEWDNLVAEIQNNVRILVDFLPGLVMDATRDLPDGFKRIVAIKMAA